MLNQININIKFILSAVTPKFADDLDYNILLLKISWSAELLEQPPHHEVAAKFCVWIKELTDHLPAC